MSSDLLIPIAIWKSGKVLQVAKNLIKKTTIGPLQQRKLKKIMNLPLFFRELHKILLRKIPKVLRPVNEFLSYFLLPGSATGAQLAKQQRLRLASPGIEEFCWGHQLWIGAIEESLCDSDNDRI